MTGMGCGERVGVGAHRVAFEQLRLGAAVGDPAARRILVSHPSSLQTCSWIPRLRGGHLVRLGDRQAVLWVCKMSWLFFRNSAHRWSFARHVVRQFKNI